jgi:glutamate/tyrosine decarboxylase-like PLP-dependent enzyme
MFWNKRSKEEMNEIINQALSQNADFRKGIVLGVPGTYLDREVFHELDFLKEAPYLKSFVENPNHIGCHTEGDSEAFFKGTQKIEVELLKICAEQILKANPNEWDGYMATGGTEGNIQGLWTQRNYFIDKYDAKIDEIAIISSNDTHYSVDKSSNLLGVKRYSVKVHPNSREILENDLQRIFDLAKSEGKKYYCCILNMGTTMFGSVDDIDNFCSIADKQDIKYLIHIDAAFGGFIYPFTNPNSKLTFEHKLITSFSLDAHKMLQAPYGSGIYLMRKGLLNLVMASSANYVQGMDSTLCGSRSGSNAIATWMILNTYGSTGGVEFCKNLISITDRFCKQLNSIGAKYFRNKFMNIVTISKESISSEVAKKFHLVPDCHTSEQQWWKVVVMDHVSNEDLDKLFEEMRL